MANTTDEQIVKRVREQLNFLAVDDRWRGNKDVQEALSRMWQIVNQGYQPDTLTLKETRQWLIENLVDYYAPYHDVIPGFDRETLYKYAERQVNALTDEQVIAAAVAQADEAR